MAAAYALGVFNDQFFKQSASLLAVGEGRASLQGYAAALMALPFVLLAAPAGWCADRFPKRTVIIASKALEVVAMMAGALGLYLLSWPLVLLMVLIMGAQSTLFSPALNGAIPECFPPERVLPVNGVLKMTTTAAMLAGIILAGVALAAGAQPGGQSGIAAEPHPVVSAPPGDNPYTDKAPNATATATGRLVAGGAVLLVAVLGFLISWAVPGRPAANPSARFPRRGPLDTLNDLRRCRRDPFLWRVLKLNAFIWAVAAALALWINQLGLDVFALDERETSLLLTAMLAGLVVGGGLAGRLGKEGRWPKLLGWAALTASAGGFLTAVSAGWAASAGTIWLAALSLAVMGAGGGMFLVPLESFVQVRPEPGEKGRIIAANNALAFSAIMLAGLAFALADWLGLPSAAGFILLAGLLAGVGLWCYRHMRQVEPRPAVDLN